MPRRGNGVGKVAGLPPGGQQRPPGQIGGKVTGTSSGWIPPWGTDRLRILPWGPGPQAGGTGHPSHVVGKAHTLSARLIRIGWPGGRPGWVGAAGAPAIGRRNRVTTGSWRKAASADGAFGAGSGSPLMGPTLVGPGLDEQGRLKASSVSSVAATPFPCASVPPGILWGLRPARAVSPIQAAVP